MYLVTIFQICVIFRKARQRDSHIRCYNVVAVITFQLVLYSFKENS